MFLFDCSPVGRPMPRTVRGCYSPCLRTFSNSACSYLSSPKALLYTCTTNPYSRSIRIWHKFLLEAARDNVFSYSPCLRTFSNSACSYLPSPNAFLYTYTTNPYSRSIRGWHKFLLEAARDIVFSYSPCLRTFSNSACSYLPSPNALLYTCTTNPYSRSIWGWHKFHLETARDNVFSYSPCLKTFSNSACSYLPSPNALLYTCTTNPYSRSIRGWHKFLLEAARDIVFSYSPCLRTFSNSACSYLPSPNALLYTCTTNPYSRSIKGWHKFLLEAARDNVFSYSPCLRTFSNCTVQITENRKVFGL
ncbi:hypothetical protein YC2023_088560 [Brassica napus]